MIHSRFGPVGAWLLALCLASPALAGNQVDVAQELERLMAQYGFQMNPDHLALTRDVQGRAEGDELLPRLNNLLDGFDHVIVQGPQGVERVLILGPKAAYVPPPPAAAPAPPAGQAPADAQTKNADIVLQSQRKGSSHALNLTLEGANGQRVQRTLLLDTGADFVVLPTSLIAPLGIAPNTLHAQRVQTANGPIDARLANLAAIWLGDRRLPAVETAFIDDAKLGGSALLGMSVLGRFRVTIDDAQNQVVLSGK